MQNEQLLDVLQSRLRAHGHGVTLQRIPPGLFIERNGNVLLDFPSLCRADVGHSAVYAFLHDGSLRFSMKTIDGWQKLMATAACLEGAYLVPPFVHVPLELLTQDACKYEVMAMLEYYLLIWAIKNGYPSWARAPVYEDLEGMFRILQRTHTYANDDTRQDMDEERSALYAVAIANNDVRDTVESISIQESVSEENPHIFSEESAISQAFSRTNDNDPASAGPVHSGTRLDDTSEETATVLDTTLERGTTVKYTSAQPTGIESIVPDNLHAHEGVHHNFSLDGMRENTLKRSNRSETLQLLRKEHGPLLGHLPTTDGIKWEANYEDPRYIPLACRIGGFRDSSKLKGSTAWAFFKKISSHPSKSPSMELFTRHANNAWADNSARRNLRFWFEDLKLDIGYEMCARPEDVITLTTYFYLLEQERSKESGDFAHVFLHTQEFSDILAALAKRHRAEEGRSDSSIGPLREAGDVNLDSNLDQEMTGIVAVESDQDDEVFASLPARKTPRQYRKRPIVLSSPVTEAHEHVSRLNLDLDMTEADAAECGRDEQILFPVPAPKTQTRVRIRPIVLSNSPASPTAREGDGEFSSPEWPPSWLPMSPRAEGSKSDGSTNCQHRGHDGSEDSTLSLGISEQRHHKGLSSRSQPENDTDTDTTIKPIALKVASGNSASPGHGQSAATLGIVGVDDELRSDDEDDSLVLRIRAKSQTRGQTQTTTLTISKTRLNITEPTFISAAYARQYKALVNEANNVNEAREYQEKVLKKAKVHKQETEEDMTDVRYVRSRNGTLRERPATEIGKLRYRNGRLRLMRLEDQIKVAKASVEVFEGKKRESEEKMERLMHYAVLESNV